MSFVAAVTNVLKRNTRRRLGKNLDRGDRTIGLGLATVGLRHDARDWLTVAG